MASPAWAGNLTVVYPQLITKTTAEGIFLIGTAPPAGEVVNGKAIPQPGWAFCSVSHYSWVIIFYFAIISQIQVKRVSTS